MTHYNIVNIRLDDRSWQDRANCLGVDPDLFFPERGASTREAKEVCRGCVVREDCLEYALANGEKFGIWGGMSERERRRVRRQRAQAARRPRHGLNRQPSRSRPADAGLDRAVRAEVELRPALARAALQHRLGQQTDQLGPVDPVRRRAATGRGPRPAPGGGATRFMLHLRPRPHHEPEGPDARGPRMAAATWRARPRSGWASQTL